MNLFLKDLNFVHEVLAKEGFTPTNQQFMNQPVVKMIIKGPSPAAYSRYSSYPSIFYSKTFVFTTYEHPQLMGLASGPEYQFVRRY